MEEIEGTFLIDSILCKKKKKKSVHPCLNSGPLQAKKMFSPSVVCISPAVLCAYPVRAQLLHRCLPGLAGDRLLALGSFVLSGLNTSQSARLAHGMSTRWGPRRHWLRTAR